MSHVARHRFMPESAAEDLVFGQGVIVTARWILVLAGLFLALWNPASLIELRVEILVVLVLAVVNFYLHVHLIVKRATVEAVVLAASAVDLLVVTLLIVVQGGLDSHLYIFYFPAILGLSVAFPTALTLAYAGGAALAYGSIGLFTASSQADIQSVVSRVLMLAAIAACGNLYWRIEHDRRVQPGLVPLMPTLASAAEPPSHIDRTATLVV